MSHLLQKVACIWFSQEFHINNLKEVRLAYFKLCPAHHFSEIHARIHSVKEKEREQTPLIIKINDIRRRMWTLRLLIDMRIFLT